jgi:phage tail-like protein
MVAGRAGLVHRQPVPAGVRSIAAGPVRLRAGVSAVRLVAVLAGANQALSFTITPERLVPAPAVLPLRQHRGRALVAAPGGLLFDTGDPPPAVARWVPVVEQARRTLAASATLDTPLFDAGLPGTVWDRIEIDACLPPGTRLVVEARASDDPARLGPWRRQPQPIAAATPGDLGNHGAAARFAPGGGTGSGMRGSVTLLLQQISGRHAQVRLRLEGDGQAGPQLFALRLHYPRQPWHHRHLPAIYRETPDADDFMGRFLGNMQGISDGIEQRITGFSRLLAPQLAPADALPWLASWFDVALDPAWDDDRRRAFIAHAVRFLAWRGTMHGLESALALGLGARLDGTLFDPAGSTAASRHGVRIVEQYRLRGTDAALDESGLAARAVSEETARWQAWQRQLGLAGAAIAPTLPAAMIPAAQADAWAQFTALASPDRQLWQRFLAARWRRIAALNRAHDANWPDFAAISLPPAAMRTATGAADWADFAQRLLPMARAAHRFAVLLPVAPGEAQDSARLAERRRLASRLIALEKPAHTLFEVRFYFAANRLGEARLGLDTALGQGSRAPELLPPAVLGQVYAGQALVGAPGSMNERERIAC